MLLLVRQSILRSVIALVASSASIAFAQSAYEPPCGAADAQMQENASAFGASRPAVDVIEYGAPRPVVDAIGWGFGIPNKVLMWDRRADNHHVTTQTVDEVANYLEQRDLSHVMIRVNQYDPVGNWRRLVANKNISPGWKYTAGTLYQIKYALLPGRVFGGDDYDPFTDTLNLYSDMPAMGLAEAAYAHDVQQRQSAGVYATVQMLPLVSMWHETLATDEVMTYVAIRGSSEDVAAIRKDLYARYGIKLGGEIGSVTNTGAIVFPVVGAVAGHATAAIKAEPKVATEANVSYIE